MRQALLAGASLVLALFSAAHGTPRGVPALNITFSGRVLDAETGSAIQGAQVVLQGTAQGTLTDPERF